MGDRLFSSAASTHSSWTLWIDVAGSELRSGWTFVDFFKKSQRRYSVDSTFDLLKLTRVLVLVQNLGWRLAREITAFPAKIEVLNKTMESFATDAKTWRSNFLRYTESICTSFTYIRSLILSVLARILF